MAGGADVEVVVALVLVGELVDGVGHHGEVEDDEVEAEEVGEEDVEGEEGVSGERVRDLLVAGAVSRDEKPVYCFDILRFAILKRRPGPFSGFAGTETLNFSVFNAREKFSNLDFCAHSFSPPRHCHSGVFSR